jgi:hypothetical protein
MVDRTSPSGGRSLVGVAVAVLAVVAVVLAAAAVAPVFSQETGGDGSPQVERPEANQSAAQSTGDGLPLEPVVVAILVLGVLAVAVQAATNPWGTLKAVLGVGTIAGLAYLVVSNLGRVSPSSSEEPPRSGGAVPEMSATNGSAGFEEGAGTAFSWSAESIALVAVAAATVAVVALFVWRPGAVRSTLGLPASGDEADGTDLGTVGRVAGDAADRVETAETPRAADNAIYRAWSEMVALLDAPGPQSGTPRQFEAAAVESGMSAEDVRVLTRTFEEVRYGDASLSEERRERATAALRRIERAYGDARDGAGGGR